MRDTVERRLSIVAALCKRHSDTIGNLAVEYGVSDRTIRTDIASLSYSFPIYTQQGNGGGVFMDGGYTLGREYLTQEQENLLVKLSRTLSVQDAKTIETILHEFARPRSKKEKTK